MKPSRKSFFLLTTIFCTVFLLFSGTLHAQQAQITQRDFDSIARLHSMFYDNPFIFWHAPKEYGVSPETLEELLVSNPQLKGRDLYYCRKAVVQYLDKERDSALNNIDKSIEAYQKIDHPQALNKDAQMLAYYIKGKGEVFNRDYNESTKSMQIALNIAREQGLSNWFGPCLFGIGRNHFNLGNDSIALQKFIEATKDSVQMSHARPNVAINSLIASLYEKLGNIQRSKEYAFKAIYVSDTSDFKANLFPLYGLLADVYKTENNEDSLRYFYKKAIDRYEQVEIHNPNALRDWDLRYSIYKSYLDIIDGKHPDAVKNLNAIIHKLITVEKPHINDKGLLLLAIEYLGKSYELQGKSGKYTELFKWTASYLDRFQEVRIAEQLERLEVEYDAREKDLQITQLESSKKQQLAIISQQRVINFALLGLLLLSLGIVFLYLRQKKLKSLVEKQFMEQRLLRAQMNPHFTFNTLAVIQNMITSQPEKAKTYLVKFSRLLVSIFESSTQSYLSVQEELNSLKQYLELQKLRNPNQFSYEIRTPGLDTDTLQIPGMLLQPIVENCILHGFAEIAYEGKIEIVLKRADKLIFCHIEDNGSGLHKTKSNGRKTSSIDLIASFLEKITKKKFSMTDKVHLGKGNGVLTEFYIPFKNHSHA